MFIYLDNADVENCGEVKGFGFIYIYRLEFGKRTEVHMKLKIENKVIKYGKLHLLLLYPRFIKLCW